jgi:hypothetical protein
VRLANAMPGRYSGPRLVRERGASSCGEVDLKALESNLRGHRIPRHVAIPQDERLRQMLDSGTYVCERLERRTRTAVKRLALAVAEQLV